MRRVRKLTVYIGLGRESGHGMKWENGTCAGQQEKAHLRAPEKRLDQEIEKKDFKGQVEKCDQEEVLFFDRIVLPSLRV